MNPTRQFWALFKFTALLHPRIFLYPLLLGLGILPLKYILLCTPTAGTPHLGFGDSLQALDLLFCGSIFGFAFLGVVGMSLLAPDTFSLWGITRDAGEYEYLLSRAVDRPILCRARVALFYLIVLVVPLASFTMAFVAPELKVTEFDPARIEAIVAALPGSVATQPQKHTKAVTITIPQGNVLAGEWQVIKFVAAALMVQMTIFFVLARKKRKERTALIIPLLAPLYMLFPVFGIPSSHGGIQRFEQLFFVMAHHQAFFWAAMLGTLVLGQLWCERRFARMEI